MKLSTPGCQIALMFFGLSFVADVMSAAPVSGSLSDLEIKHGELRVAFEKLLEENSELRQVLSDREKALVSMRASLSAANGESEIFKRQAIELKLRIEALGLETAGADNAKLEQRLLNAVREMRILAEEKRKLSEALVRLTEGVSLYAKTAIGASPESRLALEMELRNASSALGANPGSEIEARAIGSTLTDGRAISIKEDLALVVMNIGSKHGVKVGMPFDVSRGDLLIGSVRVVDVREAISGAVVQNLESEKEQINVGDRLKVSVQR